MSTQTVRLADRAQDIFIAAQEIDPQLIRLDVSDAYNDSSTELTVDRAALLNWCRAMIDAFENTAKPASDSSPQT